MKRLTSIVAMLAVAFGLASAQAQQTLYWDVTNGTAGLITPGSFADGTWDNGTSANWNPNSDGSGSNVTWNDAASPADNAVFRLAVSSKDTARR